MKTPNLIALFGILAMLNHSLFSLLGQTPATDQPATLEQALQLHQWNSSDFNPGARPWGRIRFDTAAHEFVSMNTRGEWKPLGDRKIALGDKFILTFDARFERFEATDSNGTRQFTGTRVPAMPIRADSIFAKPTPPPASDLTTSTPVAFPQKLTPSSKIVTSFAKPPPPLASSLTTSTPVALPKATPSWKAVVLEKPFHAGDSHSPAMTNPNPDGRTFVGSFELPTSIKPNVATNIYVNLQVAGVPRAVGKVLNRLRNNPEAATWLLVNDQQSSMLNEIAKSGGDNSKSEKMTVRVAGTMLREGSNRIEIVPGRSGQMDDIELIRVIVSSRAE